MVTKQTLNFLPAKDCLILAKFHMVTKHMYFFPWNIIRLILAKFHMVTKQPQFEHILLQLSNSSKIPYGNKTDIAVDQYNYESNSSKIPYGNKTSNKTRI